MNHAVSQHVKNAIGAVPVTTGDEPCRGAVDVFYPPTGARLSTSARLIATARSICIDCPQQQACLDGALERDEKHGVWGGVNFNVEKKHNQDGRESVATRRRRINREIEQVRMSRQATA